jgi:hypothetical protein
MRLLQNIMTKNLAYIENRWIIPRRIVWHSTGANNPNLRRYVGPDDGLLGVNKYKNYWNRPYEEMKRKIAPHGAIGKLADETIATYLLLPIKDGKIMRGHHTGTGKNGNGNDTCIGFEICEDGLNDKAYAMAVYKEACEFTAYLCEQFNLDPLGEDVIIDHARAHQLGIASNHGDVMHWFGRYGITLDKIRRDVWALLEPEPTPAPEPAPKPKPKPSMDDKIKAWDKANTLKLGSKGKTVEVLQRALAGKGYNVVVIDGDFGSVTDREVRKYQTDNKLFVDGICGPQTWEAIMK